MFILTEDQEMIRELIRDLAQSELNQYAADVDNEACFPGDSLAVMAESGMLGVLIPEEFDGAGLDTIAEVLVVEEAAKVCSSTAAIVAQSAAVQAALLRFASSEMQKKILPQLAGDKLATIAIGEGDADCPLTEQKATAQETDGGYLLNGIKCYVLNAGHADWYLTAALVPEKGLTVFLISADKVGLGQISPKMGQRACISGEIRLENCHVDTSAIVGNIGGGALVIAELEDHIRLGSAAQAVGIAQGAMDRAIQYINERVQFGKRISQFQNTQQVMASLQARLEAARLLLWSAAGDKSADKACSGRCSMAKVVAADLASETTRKCVQFMGGFGYSREYPVERMMRDAKMTEVYGGTVESQKAVIAAAIGVS